MDYSDLPEDKKDEVIEALEKELEWKEKDCEEWEEKAKKIKADFENYKKRQDERKERWQHQAKKELAEDLIEVIDNLERAILSAEDDSPLLQGVKMVADQLYEKLEKEGLERIDAEGEEFDPRLHKAVDSRTHEEENKVLEQKRKGYMFNDKVLREAEVIISEKQD